MIRSIGYEVADWIEEHCVIPDGDRQGEPYELTTEMLRFLEAFYEVDERGRFRYRRGQLVRPQKWGKGPFSAAMICAEAYGPVLFSHFDADGRPRGKPWPTPHIQITAVSEDQTANVWRALQPMIELGNLAADIPDTGLTRINLPGGGLIEPVTASARSRLGQRITFAVQDETHSWLKSNGGHTLADNQRRNLAGMGGRSIETTNAWDPAEGSVAQQTWESESPDILKDMTSPRASLSIRNKRERVVMFREVYADSARPPLGWVDLERIDAEAAELIQRDAAQAERFFGNRIVADEDAFIAPAAWDECAGEPAPPADGAAVTLGFDGSLYDDTTGLVGCDVESGHLFVVGVWDPLEHDGEVPKHAVDAAVASAFDRWQVRAFYGDPPYWQEDLGRWYGRHGDVVKEWWTNRPKFMGDALELFHTSVMTKAVTHDRHPLLATHVGNARRFKDRGHLAVRKKFPQSPDKIDLLVCAVLALEARNDVLREPPPEEKRPGRLVVF
ncbi:MAG: hypothetical protein K1X95_15490 [Acidimicrobiia bacterium]|nr:hypothetical protein [Acidimicrobiia bacterium]